LAHAFNLRGINSACGTLVLLMFLLRKREKEPTDLADASSRTSLQCVIV
jgi:hypothetical protein